MKLVFIGDVVGRPGRRMLRVALDRIREQHRPDVVIANAENSAGGFGFDANGLKEMRDAGVDFFTTGNHVWDKTDSGDLLDTRDDIVRPANYPDTTPGVGSRVVNGTGGRVAVINVQGRVYMNPLPCPFRAVDRELDKLGPDTSIILVDVHAEATSEKIAMAWHLDGRVSAVVGTHTHVPTGDQRVFPQGTAFVCDVGMTGAYDGVLGMKKDAVLSRFLTMRPSRFEVAKHDLRCDYVVIDVDQRTGRAESIDHYQEQMES